MSDLFLKFAEEKKERFLKENIKMSLDEGEMKTLLRLNDSQFSKLVGLGIPKIELSGKKLFLVPELFKWLDEKRSGTRKSEKPMWAVDLKFSKISEDRRDRNV